MMFDKLDNAENRYDELNHELANPDVISDNNKYRSYMKEHAEIEPIVMKYRQYRKVKENYEEAKNILDESKDSEMIQFAKMEMNEAGDKLEKIKDELKVLLLPKDPNDEKNVIVEIRGGAGGDEANLFASDLFRMYTKYAEKLGWKVSVMDISETGIGGVREVVFSIEGEMAYSKLKFESGVHRVQRVPETETSGRIHTSTVTVAVLPEVDDVDVEIDQNDLRIDTYRSSGAGGQHVNKTDSAIRITHMPSRIVVACQDERSQHKNKDKALRILRAKLYERAVEEQESKIAKERKSQVGRGNRNERIRTYNFPQGRVTDHRINLTLYKLDNILEGDLHEVIEALRIDEQTQNLEQIGIED